MGEARAIQRERMPATKQAARHDGSSWGRVRETARQPIRYTTSVRLRPTNGNAGRDHAASQLLGSGSESKMARSAYIGSDSLRCGHSCSVLLRADLGTPALDR